MPGQARPRPGKWRWAGRLAPADDADAAAPHARASREPAAHDSARGDPREHAGASSPRAGWAGGQGGQCRSDDREGAEGAGPRDRLAVPSTHPRGTARVRKRRELSPQPERRLCPWRPKATLGACGDRRPKPRRPITLHGGRRRPEQGGIRAVRIAAFFACTVCTFLPEVSGAAAGPFNPMFQFEGQVLTICNDPPLKVYDEDGIQVDQVYAIGCQDPFIEPQVVTTEQGRLKACTHDSSAFYRCTSEASCECFGSCLPNVGFPPECLDVVYALEDTWGYLGVYINHGPGQVGYHLPFPNDLFPDHALMYKMTVSYGELDLLGTLANCTWEQVDGGDPESEATIPGRGVARFCEILPRQLPGEWGTAANMPYHIRYKIYNPVNFVKKFSLEMSGRWEQLDRLIRLVQYKSRWNENSNRIKSSVYNKLTYDKVPNEFLFLEAFNLIDALVSRVLQRTDR